MTVEPPVHALDLDEIAKVIGRADAVSSAPAVIEAHSHDWWPMTATWRSQGKAPYCPEAVVSVRSEEEVSAVLSWAHRSGVAVTPWGLGSSVVGGPLATRGGICLDLRQMSQIVKIDTEDLQVTVEAGMNGGVLEDRLMSDGWTLNHSPQSLHRSSVGGWLATRATGQFSSRYGGIEELCASFRAVLSDGTRIAIGHPPRMAVGPDLRQVLIGSEGCLGVITQVTLRMFPKSQARELQTLTFPDVAAGIAAMRAIMMSGIRPFLLRFYDLAEARHAMQDPAFQSPVMFLGTEGSRARAALEMEELESACAAHGGKTIGRAGAVAWMERRFDFSTIEKVLATPGGVAETIEVANTWSGIGATYEALIHAMMPHATDVLGHFSHAYSDGASLYVILLGQEENAAAAEERMKRIWEDAMRATLSTGGVISHHHGTGLARSAYVREALGEAWPLYDRLKTALDPGHIMNPGKLGH